MTIDTLPLVSVIIPAFNSANYISGTLDSVLAQTYCNWECIIIDDGSTDDTVMIVDSYVERDLRFQYYPRPEDRPKGGNACRNYGFELSQGEYINWLDSDDLFVSDKLEFQLSQLLNSSNYAVSITQTWRFKDNEKEPYRPWRYHINSVSLTDDLILGVVGWASSAPLWRRDVLPTRPYREDLRGAQEWYFHILQSILIPQSHFHFSDYSTVLIRENSESMTYAASTGTRAANYLDARTALTHALNELGQQSKIKLVVDTARKQAKQIVSDKSQSQALTSFADALFIYDKPRWRRLMAIIYINKIAGAGERLFNYL